MRINDTADAELLLLTNRAVMASRDPKPPEPPPEPSCTAVWAESFAKIMGEGVCGEGGQMLPGTKRRAFRVDFANSSRRASRWDIGCWTEAAPILAGKCEVLTMEQRHAQWPLGTPVVFYASQFGRRTIDDPLPHTERTEWLGTIAKHHLVDEEPYGCTVHLDDAMAVRYQDLWPMTRLNQHDAIVPFYAIEKLDELAVLRRKWPVGTRVSMTTHRGMLAQESGVIEMHETKTCIVRVYCAPNAQDPLGRRTELKQVAYSELRSEVVDAEWKPMQNGGQYRRDGDRVTVKSPPLRIGFDVGMDSADAFAYAMTAPKIWELVPKPNQLVAVNPSGQRLIGVDIAGPRQPGTFKDGDVVYAISEPKTTFTVVEDCNGGLLKLMWGTMRINALQPDMFRLLDQHPDVS